VDLPHFGQSVLLVVSITFIRSAVLAILAIKFSPGFRCGFILAFENAVVGRRPSVVGRRPLVVRSEELSALSVSE
jgi:hypothetical protein